MTQQFTVDLKSMINKQSINKKAYDVYMEYNKGIIDKKPLSSKRIIHAPDSLLKGEKTNKRIIDINKLFENSVKFDKPPNKGMDIQFKTKFELIQDMLKNKPNMYNGYVTHIKPPFKDTNIKKALRESNIINMSEPNKWNFNDLDYDERVKMGDDIEEARDLIDKADAFKAKFSKTHIDEKKRKEKIKKEILNDIKDNDGFETTKTIFEGFKKNIQDKKIQKKKLIHEELLKKFPSKPLEAPKTLKEPKDIEELLLERPAAHKISGLLKQNLAKKNLQ
jgi:hypothetical protein